MLSRKNNSFFSQNRGFTLLEVIISVFILTTGIFAAVSLITLTTRLTITAKNTVIAANLAQEGIEVVLGIRNANWIQGEAYDAGLVEGDNCINYSSTDLFSCDFKIYWNGTSYSHSASEATPYQRRISIENALDDESVSFLRVESIVSWDDRQIIIEEHLYDWK